MISQCLNQWWPVYWWTYGAPALYELNKILWKLVKCLTPSKEVFDNTIYMHKPPQCSSPISHNAPICKIWCFGIFFNALWDLWDRSMVPDPANSMISVPIFHYLTGYGFPRGYITYSSGSIFYLWLSKILANEWWCDICNAFSVGTYSANRKCDQIIDWIKADVVYIDLQTVTYKM